MTPNRHGGKRPGAGRPVKDKPAVRLIMLKPTLAEWDEIKAAADLEARPVAHYVLVKILAMVRKNSRK